MVVMPIGTASHVKIPVRREKVNFLLPETRKKCNFAGTKTRKKCNFAMLYRKTSTNVSYGIQRTYQKPLFLQEV